MLHSKQSVAFLAVAELGSFDLAAEQLCISASAVTLRVQSLEKSLGHILIIRERPYRVTQSGQELLQYLQHTRLMQQDLIQQLSGKSASSDFCKVSIASNADSLATWLFPTLQQTLIQHCIALELKIKDQTQTHTLLESGLVNACISTESTTIKGCVVHAIGAMRYRMVATPQFVEQWFKNGMTRQQIQRAPAVIYDTQDQLHHHLMLKYFGLNQHGYPQHHIPSSSAFAEAIFQSLGFGLLPEYQIGLRLDTAELIEVLPEFQTQVMLYWHHCKQQSKALAALTTALLKHAESHMNFNHTHQ